MGGVDHGSAAIGADGTRYVVYGGDAVRLVSNDGTGWRTELVAPQGTAARILVLQDGSPLVAFTGPPRTPTVPGYTNNDVLVAQRGPTGWETQVLQSNGPRPEVVDLQLGADGSVWILTGEHNGYDNGRVWQRNGNNWTAITTPAGFDVYQARFVVDPAGSVVLATTRYNATAHGPDVRVSRYANNVWQNAVTVLNLDSNAERFALAILPNGRPAVSARTVENRESVLGVWQETATGWVQQSFAGCPLRVAGMAVAPDGRLLVGGLGSGQGAFDALATVTGSSCSMVRAGHATDGSWSGFAWRNETGLLVTQDAEGKVRASVLAPTGASTVNLHQSVEHGHSLVTARMAQGTFAVASVERWSGRLFLSQSTPQGDWTSQEVPTGAGMNGCHVVHEARYSSSWDAQSSTVGMAVDAGGGLHLAYLLQCAQTGTVALRLSHLQSNVWTAETVLDRADWGPVRLNINARGNPVIARGTQLLTYNGANWTSQDFYGFSGNLILDDSDRPILAAGDVGDVGMWIRNPGQPELQLNRIVTNGSAYGFRYARVAQAADLTLHASWSEDHYSASQFSVILRHAVLGPSGWVADTVAQSTREMEDTASDLALDDQGRPVLTWVHGQDARLRLARHNGVEWVIQTVSQDIGPGHWASLQVLNGQAHIAHQNAETRDLCWTSVPLP